MPIHTMHVDNAVFYARQVGYVDNVDIRMWANALKKYTGSSEVPMMAVIDLTDADRLCPTAIKILSSCVVNGNLLGVAIAAGDTMASRNAAVLEKIGKIANIRIFPTLDQANRYADTQVRPTFGMYSAQSYSMFHARRAI